MTELLRLILHIIASLFRPRTKLVAEILVLRQQLNVLRRQVSKRPQLSNTDRFLFVWLYRWFPSVLSAIAILRPETVIRWHRAGFQSYWRERSRKPVGRPRISAELRNLIGAMSRANHLWGAPHIHGELLKLGFTIAQSTVARYMYRGWPPSQGWRTFLTNHIDGIAAIDLSLPKIISGRNGGAAQTKLGWLQRPRSVALPDPGAHPCPETSACGPHYSSWHKTKEFAAGVLRRRSAPGPGTRDARCQSDALHTDFAMAIPARSVGRGCPSLAPVI
jgi:hypothetical protein